MSKPHNWYEMSHEERQTWQRQDNERADLEYEKQNAEREAERSARDARDAKRAADQERYAHEEDRAHLSEEIDQLTEDLKEMCERHATVRALLVELVNRWDAAAVQAIGAADPSTIPPLLAALAAARTAVRG